MPRKLHDDGTTLGNVLVGIACVLILIASIYGWAVFP